MMETIIKVDRLSFAYSDTPILKEVSFEINKGSFTGIIGPNGAGKTTLLKNMLGLLKYNSGQILIDQKDAKNYSTSEISGKISYVKQRLDENSLKVFDYIVSGRAPYIKKFQLFESEQDIEIAKQYIELLNLEKFENHSLDQLSGGERQLVQLARSMTQETPIMLLDEPTSHLDISHQIDIMNRLYEINQKMDKTIIMVLHDLNLAGEYCDELLLLNQGQISSQGPPRKVLTYENIESVFNTLVIVKDNPLSGKPYVIPVTRGMQIEEK